MRSTRGKLGSTFSLLRNNTSLVHTQTLLSAAPITSSTSTVQRRIAMRPWDRIARSWAIEEPAINETREEVEKSRAPEIKKEIVIRSDNLKPGYKIMHERFNELTHQLITATVASPTIVGFWLFFTEQTLLDSPVSMAILGLGAATATERFLQARRLSYYTHFSVLTNDTLPSVSETENAQVQAIMSGTAPQIKFNYSGLQVSGHTGDSHDLTTIKTDTLSRIYALNRLVLPTAVMTPKTEKLVTHVHHRWLTRFTLPFSIFNILSIMMKNPKDRRADDYVVLAAAAHNISDYLTGSSVGAARHKFIKSMQHCQTAQEVMAMLIDHRILNEGGMSFINEWLKHHQGPISVRVGRTGSVVVYPYNVRSVSFGGPCPIRLFPKYSEQNKPQLAIAPPEPANETKLRK